MNEYKRFVEQYGLLVAEEFVSGILCHPLSIATFIYLWMAM